MSIIGSNTENVICNISIEEKGLQFNKYHRIIGLLLLDRKEAMACVDYLKNKNLWSKNTYYENAKLLDETFVRSVYPQLPQEWSDFNYSFDELALKENHNYNVLVFKNNNTVLFKYLIGSVVFNDFKCMDKTSFELKYKEEYYFESQNNYEVVNFDPKKYLINSEEPWFKLENKPTKGFFNGFLSKIL